MNDFPIRILLATDGPKDAAFAARAAVDLSSRTGAELRVTRVWRDLRRFALATSPPTYSDP